MDGDEAAPTPAAPTPVAGTPGTATGALPQKRYFRQRAHANPFSDHNLDYPVSPAHMNWSAHFPQYFHADGTPAGPERKRVEFADVGCGYGGLLVALSPLYPETLMLGMEIRVKVEDYVHKRIEALRVQHPGSYQNVSVLRTNAMKFLPNYFERGQLTKVFILFPDPHFKKAKHKWRMISTNRLAEFAYIIREGGLLYTITDVHDLHLWMVKHLDEHPLFERLTDQELIGDVALQHITHSTEEGIKVQRNHGQKYPAVYRRLPSPQEAA